MVDPYSIAAAVNVALGVALLAVGIAAARARFHGARWMGAFLGLVAGNYILDGWPIVAAALPPLPGVPRGASLLFGVLDPAALLLFSLQARTPSRAWTKAAVLAGPALVFLHLLREVATGRIEETPARLLVALVQVPYYGSSLVLLALNHHQSLTSTERELRARALVPLAVVILSRFPLLSADFFLFRGVRVQSWTALVLELPLVVLAVLASVAFLWTAPPHAARSARGVVLRAGAALGFILAFWSLRFVPVVHVGTWPLLYSIRWYVFLALLTADAGRRDVLGLPVALSPWYRPLFTTVVLAVAFASVFGAFVFIEGGEDIPAALFHTTLTLLGVGAAFAILARWPAKDENRTARRVRVYRAHLALGASRVELERIRGELGLTHAEAAEEERLVGLETEAPSEGLDRPTVGEVFAGKYEVGPILGSGGYGLVYDAFDREARRRVVLKELRPDWRASPEAAQALLREAGLALRASSPHLVRLHAIERSADGHVLVLEHVQGETLERRLSRSNLSPAEAGRLGANILDALDALHKLGVLHRDVKPTNIVLRTGGDAVLIDLGAAMPAQESGTRPMGAAHTGTPRFMSPEARAGGRLSFASDIYSVGAVLRVALGDGEPPSWRSILDRAMAQDPSERFPSAAAFRAALPRD